MDYNSKRNKLKNTYLVIILAAAVLTMALSACQTAGTSGADDLDKIVEKLYKGLDVPAYEIINLDKDTFEGFAFAKYDGDYKAVAADALVNITAHSVVVIKTDKANGKDLAEEIVKNADPNKWLCVGAETVAVAYTDNYVVLVMSDEETTDGIVSNFKGMAKDLDGIEMNLLTKGNDRFEEGF